MRLRPSETLDLKTAIFQRGLEELIHLITERECHVPL